jgi:ribonuclease E
VADTPEPEPAVEVPPADAAEEEKPAKPARKSRKKASAKAEADPSVSAIPVADNDSAANGDDSGDEPRRGWWQRTFG